MLFKTPITTVIIALCGVYKIYRKRTCRQKLKKKSEVGVHGVKLLGSSNLP